MANERAAASVADELESLDRVRRRVVAVAFLAIVVHALIALPLLAQYLADDGKDPEAILMLVLTALAGVLTAGVTRVILGRSPFAWSWYLVGLVPTAVGIYLTWWAPFTLH